MSVTIIIPTVGTPYLRDSVGSALSQTYNNTKVMVMVDGSEYVDKVHKILDDIVSDKLFIVDLPFNTGSKGRVCHHKYAAAPFLVDTDYVAFLDEDNMYTCDHIQECINMFNKDNKTEMVYTLRDIIDMDGIYVCKDNFESTGNLLGKSFCDSSTMIVKTTTAMKYSHLWSQEWGVHEFKGNIVRPNDRLFSGGLLNTAPTACTNKYTMKYRAYDEKPNDPDFFIRNSKQHIVEPWKKEKLYICHFSPQITVNALKVKDNPNLWREQWQLPLVRALGRYYDVRNACVELPPSGSKVLFVCCFPEQLPRGIYERSDITKYLIAMESPNHMHRRNFSPDFLVYFDKVITYNTQFEGILADKYIHTLHPINLDSIDGTTYMGHDNIDTQRRTCCILANRNESIKYDVLGVKLQALEYLRHEYAKHIPGIHCYGNGWVSDGNIVAKGFTTQHPADVAKEYTFSLIVENNDAIGGVTEKIYMALFGGSIPLYYHKHGSIPNIPDSCWINIANIKPEELNSFLQQVNVNTYRRHIYLHREYIFNSVSIDSYAKTLYGSL